jgi:hypothetical protein
MFSMKNWTLAKALAVILCVFIAGEAHLTYSGQGPGQEDPLAQQFRKARDAFFSQDFQTAMNLLDKLMADLQNIPDRETLKGETFLLAGANYEKMSVGNLAIRRFCEAKKILGEGKSIEGLDLAAFKYYKENCSGPGAAGGAVSNSGTSRKNAFVKILGIVLVVAAAGGIIWYLFFSKNAPLKKKGTYTSITFRLTITYKGFNSTGTRRLWVAGENIKEESFVYTQDCNELTKCTDAVKEETYIFARAVTGDDIVVKQEFLNWDYYSLPGGTGWKKLCTDYTLDVEKYEYKDGKDPGKPSAQGLETLNQPIVVDRDCQQVSSHIHNCTVQAIVKFSAPADASKAGKAVSAGSETVHGFKAETGY